VPWAVFIIFWLLLGLLSVALHAVAQRPLMSSARSTCPHCFSAWAILPIVASTLVAILGFAPPIGGLVVDSHCHAGTGMLCP
jgi:hypothetical protein